MTRSILLVAILVLQIVCAGFFVGDLVVSVVGIPVPPINWAFYEWIQIGAALGLLTGVVISWFMLRNSMNRTAHAEHRIKELSGAFIELITGRFDEWDLTPAERDVGLFLIKGLSTQEMAELRGTSEGTIKAQTFSIYRKADVANRAQLVSLLIDDLMQDDALKM